MSKYESKSIQELQYYLSQNREKNENIIKYKKSRQQCESILDRKSFIKITIDFNKEEKEIFLKHLNKEYEENVTQKINIYYSIFFVNIFL